MVITWTRRPRRTEGPPKLVEWIILATQDAVNPIPLVIRQSQPENYASTRGIRMALTHANVRFRDGPTNFNLPCAVIRYIRSAKRTYADPTLRA